MAVEATAQIVIKGSSEALKTLQGIRREVNQTVQDAKKAAKEEERAAKAAQKAQQEAARAAQKDAQQTAKVREKATRDALRVEQKAAADLKRLQDLETRRWQDMAKKSADARIRESERAAARERESATKARKAWGGAIGALTGGAIAGGTSAMNTGRQLAGVKSKQEMVTAGNDYNLRLTRVARDAGLSKEEKANADKILQQTSRETGRDISELLGILEANQAQFNDFRGALKTLPSVARISTATGADATKFGTAIGTAKAAFNLSDDEAVEFGYRMRAAAAEGSIDPEDFAEAFASKAGTFATGTKQTGMAGAMQFLGMAQGVGTGQFGGAESANRMQSAVNALTSTDVQKELKKIGISNVVGSDGKLDVANVIDQLAANTKFKSAATQQKIFTDDMALQGINALVNARNKVASGAAGAVDMRSIAGVTTEEGKSSVDAAFNELSQDPSFKMGQLAAEAQLDTMKNLEQYNKDILLAAEASVTLEKSLGRLAIWTDSIAATGVGAAAGGMAGNMFGNMAGNLLSKGAGSLAGGLSASAAMGVIGPLIVPIVALTATALAAYGIGSWINDKLTDEEGNSDIGNWMFDLLNDTPERASERGLNAPTEKEAEAQRIRKEQLETQKRTQQAIEEVARNSRGAPMGPPPPPRGPQ